jgi:MFS family permease
LYFTTTLGRSSSDVAWIGSFEVFLLFFIGSAAGALVDAGYFRSTVTAGCLLILLGTFTASVSTTYWQLFLAQGVCCGLGNGLVFTPAMAVISTYFTTKRALAMAVAACGSTVGGLVFPSIARTLMPTIGFGWTTRIIGFVQLVTLTLSLMTIKPRKFDRSTSKPIIDWSAFQSLEYTLFSLGSFLVSTATAMESQSPLENAAMIKSSA